MKYLQYIKIIIPFLITANTVFGQKLPCYPLPTNQIINEIQSHEEGTALWWTGNVGWLIKSDDTLIGFDMELTMKNRIYEPPISPSQLAGELDVLFITHGHMDHFNPLTVKGLASKTNCTFVIPENCVDLIKKCGITEDRYIIAKPRVPFEIKGIQVEPIRAIHPTFLFCISKDANLQDCGYLITIGGKKFFHPGDSALLEDHLDIKNVNVLFVSPTVHNTYLKRSLILINHIEPDYVFPQHFGTYITNERNMFWTKGYPDELYMLLSNEQKKKYHKLKQGIKFIIE